MAKAKTASATKTPTKPAVNAAAKPAATSAKKASEASTKAAPDARIAEGEKAPRVVLLDEEGAKLDLASAGKIVVLYFYPKADTSGCTKESIAFGAANADFKKAGAVVVGISPDPVSAQKKFRTKYSLPFSLLSDADHAVATAFGVWQEKSMYGRTYFGIERSTFVIGADGKIARVYRKVKVDGHAQAVLEAVRAL